MKCAVCDTGMGDDTVCPFCGWDAIDVAAWPVDANAKQAKQEAWRDIMYSGRTGGLELD